MRTSPLLTAALTLFSLGVTTAAPDRAKNPNSDSDDGRPANRPSDRYVKRSNGQHADSHDHHEGDGEHDYEFRRKLKEGTRGLHYKIGTWSYGDLAHNVPANSPHECRVFVLIANTTALKPPK